FSALASRTDALVFCRGDTWGAVLPGISRGALPWRRLAAGNFGDFDRPDERATPRSMERLAPAAWSGSLADKGCRAGSTADNGALAFAHSLSGRPARHSE